MSGLLRHLPVACVYHYPVTVMMDVREAQGLAGTRRRTDGSGHIIRGRMLCSIPESSPHISFFCVGLHLCGQNQKHWELLFSLFFLNHWFESQLTSFKRWRLDQMSAALSEVKRERMLLCTKTREDEHDG